MMRKIPLPNPQTVSPPPVCFSDAVGIEQVLSVIRNIRAPFVITNVQSQELLHKLEATCTEHKVHFALPKVEVTTEVDYSDVDTLAPWEEES